MLAQISNQRVATLPSEVSIIPSIEHFNTVGNGVPHQQDGLRKMENAAGCLIPDVYYCPLTLVIPKLYSVIGLLRPSPNRSGTFDIFMLLDI